MQSSKATASPPPVHPEVPLVRAATAGWDTLVPTLGELIGHDTHARTAAAIRGAVQAIGSASALALSVVATTLAALHGILPVLAVRRLDRLLVNPALDLSVRGFAYVQTVLGGRTEALIALDWTEFDADDHSTLCAYLVTTHGRATPLWWRTARCADLTPQTRVDLEDQLLGDLRRALGPSVRARLLCDRGFVDAERIELWTAIGWGYVVRLRRNILVTDATGRTRRADAWLRPDGRAVRLPGARFTGTRQAVGSFVAVQQAGMKDAWFLICDADVPTATEAIALYDRRFSTEETFRDQQDPRFGLGLDQLRMADPQKRDRMLLLAAMAQVLLTLLGGAGEACGLDRGLHRKGGASTGKKRIYSLFRQGCMWIELLPTLREDRKRLLIDAFETLLRQHQAVIDLLSVL